MFAWLSATPGLTWLILAGLLAIAELIAPGVFLVFIAAGAAAVGLVTLMIPDLTATMQVLVFALASAAATAFGRQWYRGNPVPTSDPLLNDRVSRLIGQTVIVVEPVDESTGRVRVGDGEWPARGPITPAGAHVRIVGAEGSTLFVEPAAAPPAKPLDPLISPPPETI